MEAGELGFEPGFPSSVIDMTSGSRWKTIDWKLLAGMPHLFALLLSGGGARSPRGRNHVLVPNTMLAVFPLPWRFEEALEAFHHLGALAFPFGVGNLSLQSPNWVHATGTTARTRSTMTFRSSRRASDQSGPADFFQFAERELESVYCFAALQASPLSAENRLGVAQAVR